MGATTLPMSMPYLSTVSPTAMSLSATLADRNVLPGLNLEGLVLVHDPAGHRGPGFHTFNHDHGDRVSGVVQYEVNHLRSSLCLGCLHLRQHKTGVNQVI